MSPESCKSQRPFLTKSSSLAFALLRFFFDSEPEMSQITGPGLPPLADRSVVQTKTKAQAI